MGLLWIWVVKLTIASLHFADDVILLASTDLYLQHALKRPVAELEAVSSLRSLSAEKWWITGLTFRDRARSLDIWGDLRLKPSKGKALCMERTQLK